MADPKKKEVAVVPDGVNRARLKFTLHNKQIIGLRTDGDSVIVTYEDGTKSTIRNAVPVMRERKKDDLLTRLFGQKLLSPSGPVGRPHQITSFAEFRKIFEEAEKPSDIYSGPVFRIRPEGAQ